MDQWFGEKRLCALVGASLVMPGRFLQADPLARLIEREQVTFAAGVSTIWMDVLRKCADTPAALASLRRVVCGGAAVPRSLMERFEHQFGIPIIQGFGLTETSPLVAIAQPPPHAHAQLKDHLRPVAAKWWLPDEYAFIDEVPKSSVGKFDKKTLRKRGAGRSAGTRTPR